MDKLVQNVTVELVGVNAPAAHKLEINIPLESLKDQLKHIEWFDLLNANGRMTDSKVRLAIQYVYSKVAI